MTLGFRELAEIAFLVRDFPPLPKAVLVLAGSRTQFNFWVRAYQSFGFDDPNRVPNAVYLHSPHQLRGLGPEHVERIDFVGTWWRSEVARDHGSMERLARLHSEICPDVNFLRLMYTGMSSRPDEPEPCRCSADGGGCSVCAAVAGEHTERPHFVRLDVRSPAVGKGEVVVSKAEDGCPPAPDPVIRDWSGWNDWTQR